MPLSQPAHLDATIQEHELAIVSELVSPSPARQRAAQRAAKPTQVHLQNWRGEAQRRAKAQGWLAACDLCKRDVGRAYGWVWLRVPGPWRCPPRRRKLCRDCWDLLARLIRELEEQGTARNLPELMLPARERRRLSA